MPTTVVKTIGTVGGGGAGDYTTVQAWEDASPANLVTADQIWQGQIRNIETFSVAGTVLTVSGTTVDSTRYLELTTATGKSFRDNASVQSNALKYNESNGCALKCTAGYANVITVSQEFCRFSKLQIAHTGASGLGTSCCILNNTGSGSSTLTIDYCIMETAGPAGVVQLFGSANVVRNSLLVQRKSGASKIATVQNATKMYNCTCVVPSDLTAATNAFDVSNYGGSGGVFKNVAFFGASAYKTGTATPTVTTCYTDLGSPPSGATTATYANQFQNTADATRDFRLKSGANCADNGTTDSTNAATDIAGTSRPSGSAYDVGCWELVAAAANVFNILTGRGGGAAQPLAGDD